MKTLTALILSIFLFAEVSWGQNNATILQSGPNHNISIQQTFQPGTQVIANEVIVSQKGNSSNAPQIRQRGAGNRYEVLQDGLQNTLRRHAYQGDKGPSYNALIYINQLGEGNIVHDADQTGFGNKTSISQNGLGNFADVEAQYSAPTGSGNAVSIMQTGNLNSVGNGTATGVYQDGEQNEMTIIQENGATAGSQPIQPIGYIMQEEGQGLVQIGVNNNMSIDQSGSGNNIHYGLQSGVGNLASVTQHSMENDADFTQLGIKNMSTITQN